MALNETEQDFLESLIAMTGGERLSQWESGFMQDQINRFEEYGSNMSLSIKQWGVLKRIANKIGLPIPGSIQDNDPE